MATVNYGNVEELFNQLPEKIQQINQNIQDCLNATDELFYNVDNRIMEYSEAQDEIKMVEEARNKLFDDLIVLEGFFQWLDGVNVRLKQTMGYTEGIDNNGNVDKSTYSAGETNGPGGGNQQGYESESDSDNPDSPGGGSSGGGSEHSTYDGESDLNDPNNPNNKSTYDPNDPDNPNNKSTYDPNDPDNPNNKSTYDPNDPDNPNNPGQSTYSTYIDDPNTRSPYTYDPYTHSPYTYDPYTRSPYTYDPYTHSPYTYDPYTHSPYTYDPYTHSPYTYTPYTSTPYTYTPYTSTPYTYTPYTSTPYTSTPYTSSPYSSNNGGGGSGSNLGGGLGSIGGGLGGFGGLNGGSGSNSGLGKGVDGKDGLLASAAKEGIGKTSSLLDKLGKETVKFASGVKPTSGNVKTNGANIGAIAAAGVAGIGALAGGGILVGKKVISLKFTPRDWDALNDELKTQVIKVLKEVGFEDFEIETLQKSTFKVKADEINGHGKKAKKAQENDPEVANAIKKKYGFSFLTEDGKILKYLLFLILIIDGKKTIDDYNMYNIINPALPNENDVDFTYTGLTMEECIVEEEVAQEVQEDDIQFMNDPTTAKENNDSSNNASGSKEWLKDIGFENY